LSDDDSGFFFAPDIPPLVSCRPTTVRAYDLNHSYIFKKASQWI
jgi:hypothetical protein